MLDFELIGKRFNKLREESGFTQSQIAEYLGVDQSYILKCEKNERQFSTDVLEKLAELFDCTMGYFVEESSKFVPVPIALRAKGMDGEDLKSIAAIIRLY